MNKLEHIEELYYAALELPPGERADFLDRECGADAELRREVESLLKFAGKAVDFIEKPPGDLAAELFAKPANPQLVGTQLGHYRLLDRIGAGGMGEVYLAEDDRLGRKVALKLLPEEFSADSERKRRFVQEARAASALNHPNIITIYGIETGENTDYISIELVEGETLRDLIASNTLDWQRAVDIALQVASALGAAHAVGIIHRDIKPANIMIRRDGLVKVLDFGLAKLTFAATGSGSFETRDETSPNRVMGTINYMSPEQSLGEKLDARTDLFSLGVVIYEMVAGVPPFAGGSDAAIYNATLNHEPPPLTEAKPAIPPALESIIRRALAKKRDQRYQSAEELIADLRTLKQNPGSTMEFGAPAPANRPRGRRRRLALIAAAAAVAASILAGAGAWFLSGKFGGRAGATRNINYTQITSASGEELFPSLSPDSKTIVYASRESGNWDIYFQRIGGTNAINLTKDSPADDRQPVFSPDGETIAFRSERDGGGIFIMGATGESVKKVAPNGFYPAFSPDGKEIVYCEDDFEEPGARSVVPSKLRAVEIATGKIRIVAEEDGVQPNWSPHGYRIAFWRVESGAQRDIRTIPANGGESVAVTSDAALDWNPVWSPDGNYLYFVSDRSGSMNLWRVAIDEKTGVPKSEPEPVTIPSKYSQSFSFARDGKSFAYVQTNSFTNIRMSEFDPKTEKMTGSPTSVTEGSRTTTNPEISSTGELLAFDAIGDVQENLFTVRPDGSGLRQLTNDGFKNRTPRWSPDGKTLAYFSDNTGKYEGFTMSADGSDRRRVTFLPDGKQAQLPVWSPDGKHLIFNTSNSLPVIYDTSVDYESQTPVRLPEYPGSSEWFMAFSWSPDGKRLIGYGREPEKSFSHLISYDFESGTYEKLNDAGTRPVWLSDSRRFIYFHKRSIYLFDTATRTSKVLLTIGENGLQSLSISKDDRRIYYSFRKSESDIWFANFGAD